MAQEVTIYHNPDCSKSCGAMDWLDQTKNKISVINYLETPPSAEELKSLLQKLNISAFELVRKNESIYIEQFQGKELSEEEWIQVLHQHPILIERPIVVVGDQARIGRPLERIIELLS